MPRIRTTKPEHWNDKELINISLQAHLLWIASWNFSDDEGIFENDPSLLRSQVFPRRADIRLESVSQWLGQLVKARFIIPFTHNGRSYYISRTFKAHQRIDKPQPSKVPSDIIKRILQDHSENDTGSVALYSSGEESRVKGEDIGAPAAPPAIEKKDGKGFEKPSVEELKQYFILKIGDTRKPKHWPEDKCSNQADLMYDHYQTNGWVQGKGKPVKDWQAACRNWIRRALSGEFENHATPGKGKPAPVAARKEHPPGLNTIQEELNGMYDLWLENPDHCTVISVTSEHYNFLKSARMIAFNETEAAGIRSRAEVYMKEKSLEGEQAITRLMKAFGVLEFFTQLQAQARETVFDEIPAA